MTQTPLRLSLKVVGLLLLFLPLTSIAKKNDYSSKVIYGEDNRLDLFQVEDPQMKSLAQSTVALINSSTLHENGALTLIDDRPIGPTYGLCSDEPFYSQNSAAYCSGFLVSPDTIITAGHCISSQFKCEGTKFVFGFEINSEGERATSVPTSNVYSCKTLVHSVSDSYGEDFAVIKLTENVVGHAVLTLSSQKPVAGTELTVIGHPAGIPLKVAGGAAVRTVKEEYLVANLDTYGGNSGSAVFNTVTGYVEGILVRGAQDFVYENGCRRSNVCTNEGCRGEDVTLIERIKSFL